MASFNVLLLLTATLVACATASQSFGKLHPDSKELVKSDPHVVTHITTAWFNKDKKHDLTVDKVDVEFFGQSNFCKILEGQLPAGFFKIKISPWNGPNVRTTVQVFGRWNNGSEQVTLEPSEIKFE